MRLPIIALLLLLPLSGALAADPPIKPFVGEYKGEAVAKNRDSLYFGAGLRDFGVKIVIEGDGFALTTTNTRRRSGKSKTKTTTLNFYPASRPGAFKSKQSGEPADGKPYIWAEIRNQTLSVYILAAQANGGYDLLIYQRTLIEGGMKITFRRIRDGSPVRIVYGRAKRLK